MIYRLRYDAALLRRTTDAQGVARIMRFGRNGLRLEASFRDKGEKFYCFTTVAHAAPHAPVDTKVPTFVIRPDGVHFAPFDWPSHTQIPKGAQIILTDVTEAACMVWAGTPTSA